MTEIQPPAFQRDGCYTTTDDRRVASSFICEQGVTEQGNDLKVEDSVVGGLTTRVQSGGAWINRTGAVDYYYVFNDAAVTLTHSAADPTLPRKDAVIARVYDAEYSGTLSEWHLEVIEGNPSAAPILPAIPSNSILLAEVNISAGMAEIVASNIVDKRVYARICDDMLPDGGLVAVVPFSSAGNFTFSKASYPSARAILVKMWGGGGGGGGTQGTGANEQASGGGGGGGGYLEAYFPVSSLNANETVVVGSGGTGGGTANGATGADGGNSTFKGLTAHGGKGGVVGSNVVGTAFASGGLGGGFTSGGGGIHGMVGQPGGQGVVVGPDGWRLMINAGGMAAGGGGGGGKPTSEGIGGGGTGNGSVAGGGGAGANASESQTGNIGAAGGVGRVVIYVYQ